MSCQWEVQKSIYNALSSSSTFMNSINSRLFDSEEVNLPYPYVIIGEGNEISDNRLNEIGYIVTLRLDIFTKSTSSGFKQSKEILKSINDIINMKKFSLDSYTMLMCSFEDSTTFKLNDKRLVRAIYKIICN